MARSKHIPKAKGGGRRILTVREMQLCQQHLFILAYKRMLRERAERNRIRQAQQQDQQEQQESNDVPVVSDDKYNK